MHLRLLASAQGRGGLPSQPLTTFLVDSQDAGPLAIDAGSIGLLDDVEEMARVRGLVLTHAHIDHVASLPMYAEALVARGLAPVRVHASEGTIRDLRAHLFSGPLFPDFEALRDPDGCPLMELRAHPVEEPFDLAGFRVTAFPVDHPVPTHGLAVEGSGGTIVFGADSGPTTRLWEIAAAARNLRAIVLETSFPDALQAIADGSGHLTPRTLARELDKAPQGARILVTHMKPAFRKEVRAAIEALDDERIRFLLPGEELAFEPSTDSNPSSSPSSRPDES